MNIPSLRDIVIFSRITGAALLITGYLLAGLWCGLQLIRQGWPHWTLPVSLLIGLIAAILAGIHEIKAVLAIIENKR